MRNIWLAGIGGAVAGVVVSTQFAAPIVAQEAEKEKSVYQQLDLFGDIFERIRTSYVEEVDDKELVESAINGMLTHLDPHSSYLPPEDFDDMRVQTKGEFGGLGIEVTQENGFVKVVAPIEGTPADRAGRAAGRPHRPGRRRERDGADARGGGRPDARPGRVGHHRDPPARGHRGAVRRQDHPRDDHHLAGQGTARGRGGGAPAHDLQRADLSGARGGAEEAGRGRRRDRRDHRLRHRPAQQPGRALEPGDLGRRRLPRVGRDRLDARARPARQRALQRDAGRPDRRQAAGGRHQRRLGERVGDRRGGAEGSPAGDGHRHAELRQGLGADDHAGAGRGGDPADHGALLHAVGAVDPGARRRARHHRRAARAARRSRRRRIRRSCRRGTRPICAARWRTTR